MKPYRTIPRFTTLVELTPHPNRPSFPPGYNLECEKSTSVNYFWYRETLNITDDIEKSGSLQWWIVVCLGCSWCIVFACFIKGIDSMGKVIEHRQRGHATSAQPATNKALTFFAFPPGRLRDCYLPVRGADHLLGPWPHSARSHRRSAVPFHS